MFQRLIDTLIRIVFRKAIEWYFNVEKIGLENIPSEGPLLFIGNHKAVLDSYIIGSLTNRPVVFMSKKEHLEGKGLKGWLLRKLLEGRSIPVDRESLRGSLEAMNAMAEHIASGGVGGIHPEGTRTPGTAVYRAKPGFVTIVRKATELIQQRAGDGVRLSSPVVPVVPVALIGTASANRPGKRIPRFRSRIRVVVGTPLDLTDPIARRLSQSSMSPSAAHKIVSGFAKARKAATGETETEYMARKVMEYVAALGNLPYVNITPEEAKKQAATGVL
ncbi:MAG: lysophospholipid acyltransferase family protein [Candidatus Saccharimonas sp.]